ncbi:MAG: histidine phosphatase family protein [bacterium]|nr:histidine phosphatase family protein [bacterium]
MTKIYFVRHAQADNSINDTSVRPLTEKGWSDTRRVTATLKNIDIAAIYSSPYRRTIETVAHLAAERNLNIQRVDDFRERAVGEGWNGELPSLAKLQWADLDFKSGNGESLREVQARNTKALYGVLATEGSSNIVIATHGTALSTIMAHFIPEFSYDDFLVRIDRLPYIICITFNEGRFEKMEDIEVVN